ncbi:MobF family relaxase, partial [Kineosporia sp. R_H_3]|uniref:MobF family relaxase n=1 Tax=Kineosporia sp. R_H_3 TaxID=1961848 RepID=UPI0013040131
MISVGKATSAEYYTTGGGVAGGFESYYLDAVTEGEPPGVWSGRMAAELGLEGEVDARVMEQVFGRFEHPVTGEPLGSRQQKWRSVDERLEAALADEPGALPERVAQLRADIERQVRTTVLGWDATFNVPKSVTVAHTALYRAEIAATRSGNTDRAAELGAVRRGIESAVLDANSTAVAFLESLAVSRTGGGSGTAAQWIAADQVTVASFFQHTNRSIDPHLHVHNVVVNRAICADGKIRSLDGEDLLAQKFAFSAVADRALFEALARLGLDSAPRADGLGRELASVPADAIDHFSTRRARITEALVPLVETAEQAKGRPLTDWETYQLKQAVTLATRAAKDHTAWTHEELLARWDAGLIDEAGRTLDGLADVVMADATRGPVTGAALEDWSPTAVITEAVAACAERSATWGRANLISELELRLPILGIDTNQVVGVLEQLADAALDSEHVVAVTGQTPDLDAGTTRLAASSPSARRYAATGTLAAEIALREAALTRSGTRLDPAAVAAWLDTHTPTIGDDQRAAVLGLAGTDAAISVLVGPAGTGKSYTAGALAGAWRDLTHQLSQPGERGGAG